MALHSYVFFIIFEIPDILGEDTGVISLCVLHGLEFSFSGTGCHLRLGDRPCYLAPRWSVKIEVRVFLNDICEN